MSKCKCADTHEPLRGSQTFVKWKNNRCLQISCPVNLNDVFWILFADSADAITLAPVQGAYTHSRACKKKKGRSKGSPCSRRVPPPCPSPPKPDPRGHFHIQTCSQPKHPLRPGLPRPPLPCFPTAPSPKPLLLRTRACFFVSASCASPSVEHSSSCCPLSPHSKQSNSPASPRHARRTEIT